MINKIVLDSSVFNKVFLDEEDRNLAIKLLKKPNLTIIVPSFFVIEVISAAVIHKFDVSKVYKMISSKEFINLEIKDKITKELVDEACKISNIGHDKSGYSSFYDAVYHALAILNNCDFITADKKHYAKTKHLGNIRLLEDI